MAEDDKYVPSDGNPFLDPTKRPSLNSQGRTHMEQRIADAQKELSGLENQKRMREWNKQQSQQGLLNYKMPSEGYETDEDGLLRNVGYKSTKGYAAKEKTKAERAHITERTWGKFNRGETLDIYGNSERKKSKISDSVNPSYGSIKFKSPTMSLAAAPIAGGISPWVSRGFPNMCGPIMVNLYAANGGVFQSTSQEAINQGGIINKLDNWIGA